MMTPDQANEMRQLEAALLGYWDARRNSAEIAELLVMEEGDVTSMLARLLEQRREVREPSRFCSPPRRPSLGRLTSPRRAA